MGRDTDSLLSSHTNEDFAVPRFRFYGDAPIPAGPDAGRIAFTEVTPNGADHGRCMTCFHVPFQADHGLRWIKYADF